MAGFIEAIRATLAEWMGEDGRDAPFLPDGLPEAVRPAASDGVFRLIDYQGPSYAQLYLDRLRRFIGRRGVGDALFTEIARLLAIRMCYEDVIRLAQLALQRPPGPSEVRIFRLDELLATLPEVIAEPALELIGWAGLSRRKVRLRFSTASWFGVRRLKLEASLRRWRLLSPRYVRERALVERWLHMIDRALIKQPAAAAAIVHTATLIHGTGAALRQRQADWNLIIDQLAKPCFDGVLELPDLAAAIAEARAAVTRDPQQAALKRRIAELRTQASDGVVDRSKAS
ncbi:MAG TPA: DUF6537 domain-containing protein [Rhodopseudomonas sp.]|uniref:DUF6537 domain-containing protein n=1 Tax=Rhodopseudomonas sp. TaxID=1078 RepID=UPI002EDB0F26